MLLGARSEEEADVFEAEELRQCWTLVHLITMMIMLMMTVMEIIMRMMMMTMMTVKIVTIIKRTEVTFEEN